MIHIPVLLVTALDVGAEDRNRLNQGVRQVVAKNTASPAASWRRWAHCYEIISAVDAASEKPDLILMDLNLPAMNGWEATRRLTADAGTRDIPVIALTDHAMAGEREKALAAGVDEFDTKPVEFDSLLAKIDQLLAKKET